MKMNISELECKIIQKYMQNILGQCINGDRQTADAATTPSPSPPLFVLSGSPLLRPSTSDANYAICPPSVSWDVCLFSLLTFTHCWMRTCICCHCLKGVLPCFWWSVRLAACLLSAPYRLKILPQQPQSCRATCTSVYTLEKNKKKNHRDKMGKKAQILVGEKNARQVK